jgi:translation initiation factor IF-2
MLAKELEMSSKDLIAFLRTQGHKVASHMSNIEDTVAQILRDRIKPKLLKEKAIKERAAAAVRGKPSAPGGIGTAAGPIREGAEGAGKFPRGPAGPATRAPGELGRGGKGSFPPGTSPETKAWPEQEAGREKRGREKDEEKEVEKEEPAKTKDLPTRRRYFPTREEIYDSGPRFGGVRRKAFGKPRKSKDAKDDGSVTTVERPASVEVAMPITVKGLSSLMGIKAQEIIKVLWQQGHQTHINQFLTEDLVTALAVEFNVEVTFKKTEVDLEDSVREIEAHQSLPEDLVTRAPVVTFLGHVDQGKTSLLDKIRQTNVTSHEAGGITQHLGAYRVDKGNIHVVFIDTPGHQAFTEMRARGANVTDVAVLVVAADDGVMPQTEEALNHARAAKVPIVVAINKIDKPTANSMRVKQQLASLGVQPVEWGGDTEFVEVSALTGQGIDTLLETLSLTSEILEIKANPGRPAQGVVLEAEADPSRGVLVTVLIRDGTLRHGDAVLCGPAHGRIRGMWLNGVTPVSEALPSMPVKVTGLDIVPEAGDKLFALEDLQLARDIAEDRLRKKRETERAGRQQVTLETLASALKIVPEVRFILKADVRGSIEAIRSSLEALSTEEVKVKILHAGVGAINQDDVTLAYASQPSAIVLGFSVSPDERARNLAEERRIDIRSYDVIYKLLDDVRAALQNELAPEVHEEIHGHAEIRQLFKASKVGSIAGCMVTDGTISRNDQVRLRRGGRVVHTGSLGSLKRFKDDAKEVKAGFECGLKLADYEDIVVGDIIEAFAEVETPRQL